MSFVKYKIESLFLKVLFLQLIGFVLKRFGLVH